MTHDTAAMRPERAVLLVIGLAFAGYGVACLVAPAATTAWSGIALRTPSATTDLRATYGGLGIGVGGFFLYAAFRPALLAAGLLAACAACAGLAGGRLLGVLLDDRPEGMTLLALAVEATGSVLAAAALRRLRSQPG